MKKFLSALLATAMLMCTMLPVAFAEAIPANTLPTTAGEFVSYEAETHKDQFMAGSNVASLDDATTTGSLSGGGGVVTGGAGSTTVTFSIPVTVTKEQYFDIETVAAVAAHLSYPYWTVDGETFFTYSTSNGASAGFKFTASNDFPAYKHTISILLEEGTHTLVFNIPRRNGYGNTVAFALDYIKIIASDKDVPNISFAEGAKASASANGRTVAVTYDNTAVMVQGETQSCAPYYKVEIHPCGTETDFVVWSKIYATEKKADGTVADKHIRTITLPNTLCGQFYAKVYPLTAQTEIAGAVGTPITTEPFTLSERPLPQKAIRVEAEEGWTLDTKTIANSSFTSGGKYLYSGQGITYNPYSAISRGAASSPIVHTQTVTIPEAGAYDVEALLSNPQGAAVTFLSKVIIKLDGNQIISNHDTPAASMAIDGTFPWVTNPMTKYVNRVELEAKTYEITYEIYEPTGNTTQPYLFSADYIQFTPADDTAYISGEATTTLEIEDYASYFVYDQKDDEGNSTNNKPDDARVQYSANASDGAYFATDSYASADLGLTMLATIPVYVEKSGLYRFELIDSAAGSNGSLKLDGTTTLIANISHGASLSSSAPELDVLNPVTEKWSYFDAKYHSARKNTGTVYITAGAHTLDFTYLVRSAGNTTASIDYLRFVPQVAPKANISENGGVVELDEYVSYFTKDNNATTTAAVVEDAKSANGKHMRLTEIAMEKGAYLDIPVSVEKSGWYDVNAILSYKSGAYTSRITLSVDGGDAFLVNTSENPDRTDLSEGLTYLDKSYPMYRFGSCIYLTAGDHTINFFAKSREAYANDQQKEDDKGLYRVCFHADNITFTPVSGKAVANGNDVAVRATFSEPVSGKTIVAAYKGHEMVGVWSADSENATEISCTVSCTQKPETVKVMAWKDFETVAPIVCAEELIVR